MAKMGYEGRTVHFEWHNKRPEAFGYQFKSNQEYRWAQYLNILIHGSNVDWWTYEPKVFTFKERHRKRGQYTPDFYVHHKDYSDEWHEVKTSLRQKDVTRFKYFKDDYPDERIVLVLNSTPTQSLKQLILLEKARKYVDDVIIAGPILRKLGI